MYPPLCGGGWALCIPSPPTGRPYPPTAHAGPERLGCIHCCVGVAGPRVSSFSHGAPLTPKRPRQDRRDSMYLRLCGSGWTWCLLVFPRGVPIPQAAQAGPEGLGCVRRCVGVVGPCAYLGLPRGVLIPQTAQARREGLGCICRCVGVAAPCVSSFSYGAPPTAKRLVGSEGLDVSAAVWESLDLLAPRVPTGRHYPASGLGGTRVYLPLCGRGWALCIFFSPMGSPYPPNGPSRTGGTRLYLQLCGRTEIATRKCSHRAPLSPKRPRRHRRDSGVSASVWGWLGPLHSLFSHGASLSPKRPRQDRRASSVSAVVWGDGEGNAQVPQRGARFPQVAQAGAEGLGCIRRCVGVAGPCASLVLPQVIPILKTSIGSGGSQLRGPAWGGGGGSGPRRDGSRC